MRALTLNICTVRPKEVDKLHRLSIQTFKETFETQNTVENMQAYIEKKLNLEQLTTQLQNQDSFFYFAHLDKEIVGYLKLNFNKAQKESVLEGKAFEIERFYILKIHQGKGLGSQLFNKAIEIGKDKGYKQLWLGVWEHNIRALEFYAEKGLTAFGAHVFQLGQDAQTDILMQLKF